MTLSHGLYLLPKASGHGIDHNLDHGSHHDDDLVRSYGERPRTDSPPHHNPNDDSQNGTWDGTDESTWDGTDESTWDATNDSTDLSALCHDLETHGEKHCKSHGERHRGLHDATANASPQLSSIGQEDDTEWLPVTSDHWGMRVDAFLALSGPDYSRTQWQALVDLGGVKLWPQDTVPAKKDRLQPNITGVIVHHGHWPQESSSLVPCAMNLTIYYEDDDMAVIEKPAGLVVHPGHGTKDTPTLVHGLVAHWEELSVCGGSHKPGLVHRLDKETSGLLIVAKHDKAHRLLNQAFAARQVVKKYWAFVWGTPKPHFGRIHTRLARHPTMRTHQAVVHGSVGKEAITTYRVVRRHDTMSVLECGLLTGRTHQIRVHCTHIGHPIVGDAMYGHHKAWSRHGLHAHFLEIAHPIHGTIMQFSSPLPPDLQALWDDMTPL